MDKVLLKEILDTISGELHPRLRSACLLEGGVLSVCVCVENGGIRWILLQRSSGNSCSVANRHEKVLTTRCLP